jgi:6-phosphogluconolactonase (cycloisomerase 2 family)
MLATAACTYAPHAATYLSPCGELSDTPDLFSPWKMALSGDEKFLYVSLSGDQGLAWYAVQGPDGTLRWKGGVRNGLGGIEGLIDPRGLAISSDGRLVAVASGLECGLSWFERETAGGGLSYGGCYRDADRHDNAQAVAFSPDGKNIYLCGNGFIAWFTVQPSGVRLGGRFRSEDGTEFFLKGAQAVRVSPDGRQVYVAASSQDAISCFNRNVADGSLTAAGVSYAAKPRDLTLSADGRFLYVARSEDFGVDALERQDTAGSFTFLASAAGAAAPSYTPFVQGATALAASADQQSLFMVRAEPGYVDWFSRDPSTGRLAHRSMGMGRVEGMRYSCGVAYCNRFNRLYVSSWAEHRIFRFEPDTANDTLRLLDTGWEEGDTGVDGLDGVSALTVNPAGTLLVTAASDEQKIGWFTRDSLSGAVTYAGADRRWDFFRPLSYTAVAVSPDGRFAFGAGAGKVCMFAWNEASGRFDFAWETLLYDPEGDMHLVISPDGAHLYAASSTGTTTGNRIFRLTPRYDNRTLACQTEREAYATSEPHSGGMQCLSMSPDGRNLYASWFNDSTITVISRETSSGALSSTHTVVLDRAGKTCLSADGRRLYVARGDSGVAWLERDTATGVLSAAGTLRPGADGVPAGMHQVCLTPDGRFAAIVGLSATLEVYAALFACDRVTGELTLINQLPLAACFAIRPDIARIPAKFQLAAGPDSRTFYLIGHSRNSIACFSLSDSLPTTAGPRKDTPRPASRFRVLKVQTTAVVMELPPAATGTMLQAAFYSCQGRMLASSAVTTSGGRCRVALPRSLARGLIVLVLRAQDGSLLLRERIFRP